MQIGKFNLIDKLTYGLRNEISIASENQTENKVVFINNLLIKLGTVSVKLDGGEVTDKEQILEYALQCEASEIDEVLEYLLSLIVKKKPLTTQE